MDPTSFWLVVPVVYAESGLIETNQKTVELFLSCQILHTRQARHDNRQTGSKDNNIDIPLVIASPTTWRHPRRPTCYPSDLAVVGSICVPKYSAVALPPFMPSRRVAGAFCSNGLMAMAGEGAWAFTELPTVLTTEPISLLLGPACPPPFRSAFQACLFLLLWHSAQLGSFDSFPSQ